MAHAWKFDWDYEFDPRWTPSGSPVQPWFLIGSTPSFTPETYWKIALAYRPEKIAFVRQQLQGVDRPAALKQIIDRIWDRSTSDRERLERLITFVQRMIFWPPIEQPLEADALRTLRRNCCAPTDHGEPYPEDTKVPWAALAFSEARAYGKHVGIWCSRVGQKLSGDWGLGGVVHDALELLMLHEGRCGHQAAVLTQLAQTGGWRARLVQGVAHRYSELFVDGRWVLADTDMFAPGSIPTTPDGDLPSLEWMRDHPHIVNSWPTIHPNPAGVAIHYGAAPQNVR